MKRIYALISAAFLLLSLCACSAGSSPEQEGTDTEIIYSDELPEDISPADFENSESPDMPESSAAPESGVEINLYKGNSNADGFIMKKAEIPELSPGHILELLRAEGVFENPVQALSFTVDNENIIHLDLDEAFARQLRTMGTSGEYMMLGSLVNTFLDAFEADGIIISIEGGNLETGHNIYDYTLTYCE